MCVAFSLIKSGNFPIYFLNFFLGWYINWNASDKTNQIIVIFLHHCNIMRVCNRSATRKECLWRKI